MLDRNALLLRAKVGGQGTILRKGAMHLWATVPPNPKADFLCLLYGSIGDNFVGFQGKILVISYNKLNTALNSDINFIGIGSLCCNMVRGESSCHGEGGCVEQQQPCLLQVVKENWEEIGISLKIDKDIRMMKDVKAKFDKARGEMSAEKVRI